MKERIRKNWFPVLAFVLTLVASLFWVALRINYSGISKFLGADTNPTFLIMNLPVMVCALSWIGCGLTVAGLFCWGKRKWPTMAGFVIGVIMTGAAAVVIYFGAWDYLRFILGHFWKSLAVAGAIVAFGLLLFFPIRGREKLKIALLALVVLAAVVIGYQLRPCTFTYGAVVYAVEDDYQIVFSTSDSAAAWVEVGGECYYDLYAGSMRSVDKVHKIEVPQHVLDAAGGYTVCAQQMIYRGPFGGYKGETISQSYEFRPVDTADGLDYFALSDVHEAVEAAAKATATRADMDFLILLGDIVSMVETEEDAQLANELAHAVTGGQIPVIYARGNHEIKGEYSEVLYKYVGSRDQDYYYTVTLGEDIFAVVLDLGEDHEDDWWEYYGTAQFDRYRQAQTEMLEDVLESGDYENYRYRMAICHIPIVYVDDGGLFEEFRQEWTQLLNEMDVDISLSGHQHKIWYFLPGEIEPGTQLVYTKGYRGEEGVTLDAYLTDFRFPTMLVGRRSLGQAGGTQQFAMTEYLGMGIQVDFDTGRQLCNYVNSEHGIISGWRPFVGDYPYDTFSDILSYMKRPEN